MKISKFQPLDKQKNQKVILAFLMDNDVAFFERFNLKFKLPYFITALVWGLPASIFQIFIANRFNENAFKDFSFLIGLMVTIIMFLMLWAIKRLRIFLVKIYSITNLDVEDYIEYYCKKFITYYNGWKLVPWGVFFGVVNMSLGFMYGIWYTQLELIIFISLQYFYVGFVAGMAVGGVYTIISIIYHLSHEYKLNLNFLASDKCGGTLEIGKILFTFSIGLFIGGLTIGSYIFVSPWTNSENFLIKMLIYFWISFPFLISIAVFVLPVIKLGSILKAYKENESYKINYKLGLIHNQLLELDIKFNEKSKNELLFLQDHLDQLLKFGEVINKMHILPYNFKLRLAYSLTVLTSIMYLIEYLRKLFYI